jgi:hypothetical protein
VGRSFYSLTLCYKRYPEFSRIGVEQLADDARLTSMHKPGMAAQIQLLASP